MECNLLINRIKETNICLFCEFDKKQLLFLRRRFRKKFVIRKIYDDGFVDSLSFKSLEITIFLGL